MTETTYDAEQDLQGQTLAAEPVEDQTYAAEPAADLSVYWGPVYDSLAKSQSDDTEITITSDDGVESRGTVDVIAEDWVAIKGKAGVRGVDTHFWLARAHITRVVDPLND